MTYLVVSGQKQPDKLLTPPVVALLLVANLVPAIALLVLLGRRIAKRRAAQSVIGGDGQLHVRLRSEEHTSELQSLMRISYAVFCLKKTTNKNSSTCQVRRIKQDNIKIQTK